MPETRYILCQGPGQAWANALAQYMQFCIGYWTSIDVSPGTYGGLRTIDVAVANDDLDHELIYIVSSIEDDRTATLSEVFSSPGWRAQVSGTMQVGAIDVGIVFDGVIVPAKKTILEAFCGATISGESATSAGGYVYLNGYWNHWMWRASRHQEVAVDELLLWEVNFGDPPQVDEDQGPPTDGLIAGGGSVMAGGAVNTASIVSALQDIATRSVDYVANNGSAIFSMYGKVNTEE